MRASILPPLFILSLMFESLKRGQRSSKVIHSFRTIQRGLTCSWQVFIYTFSSLSTSFSISAVTPGGAEHTCFPLKIYLTLQEEAVKKEQILPSFVSSSWDSFIYVFKLFNYAITAVVLQSDISKLINQHLFNVCLSLTRSSPISSRGKTNPSWTIFSSL